MRRSGIVALSLSGLCAAAGPAHAVDKFKVTSVDCEMFWLMKHTPVVHYDIVEERKADYRHDLPNDYFAQAAERTTAYCERTSDQRQQPGAAPRKIRGVWFESNDEQFKILYSLDSNAIDRSVNVVNRIGDKAAAEAREVAQHAAQVEEARTREARAQETRVAQAKAEQDRTSAQAAREQAFYDRPDLQRLRLGTPVGRANFAFVQDVRTNPFHYKRLGVAVVRTTFDRMVNDHWAEFGTDLAPIFVHLDDVDRFTRHGETVMLAFRPGERGEVQRSYGSLPEIIASAITQEPLFGEYVGAYTCPGDDCDRIFDAPPA